MEAERQFNAEERLDEAVVDETGPGRASVPDPYLEPAYSDPPTTDTVRLIIPRTTYNTDLGATFRQPRYSTEHCTKNEPVYEGWLPNSPDDEPGDQYEGWLPYDPDDEPPAPNGWVPCTPRKVE